MFKKALSEAWKWSNKWFFGSFSTAIASFFVFHNAFQFSFLFSALYGLGFIILAFFVKTISCYISIVNQLRKDYDSKSQIIEGLNTEKDRKKRITSVNYYGEAIIVLKDIFSKIHYLRKQEVIEKKEMVTVLLFLCNNLKSIFEKRFKNTYSVSIKILSSSVDINNITPQANVTTLCRDEKSYRRRPHSNDVTHDIFSNTCFNEIFLNIDKQNKGYYLNNDLVEDKYYRNTSFQVYGEMEEKYETIELRRQAWTLPYKSELVVPITPLDGNASERKQFLGYLCVDCNETNAFHTKYDIEMLRGIADGIFDIIKHNFTE